jgi:hypothetical protein
MQVRLEAMGIEDDTINFLLRDIQFLIKLSDEELDVVHGSVRAGQGTVMRRSHAPLQEGMEGVIQVIKKIWISAVDFLALKHFEGSSGARTRNGNTRVRSGRHRAGPCQLGLGTWQQLLPLE